MADSITPTNAMSIVAGHAPSTSYAVRTLSPSSSITLENQPVYIALPITAHINEKYVSFWITFRIEYILFFNYGYNECHHCNDQKYCN